MISTKDFPAGLKLEQTATENEFYEIIPNPGFVVKTTSNNQKVFLNILFHAQVPSPRLVSDSELQDILKNDNSDYKIPLSCNPLRIDMDKKNVACNVYDVCIHVSVYNRCLTNLDFKYFLVELCLQFIEIKNQTESFDRNFVFPKLKVKGVPLAHKIHRKKQPFIADINDAIVEPVYKKKDHGLLIFMPRIVDGNECKVLVQGNQVSVEVFGVYSLKVNVKDASLIKNAVFDRSRREMLIS